LAFSEIKVMHLSIHSRVNFFHIIGVLLALLLQGCSAVRLTYNNFPEISYWWLDSYMDFNDTQSTKIRADLTSLQTWHRQTELPMYIRTLSKMQQIATHNVTDVQVCDLISELKPRLQSAIDQAEPTGVALIPTLKTEQLEHLSRQLKKRSDKWRAEWMVGSLSERQARRIKQLTERAELLYGRLEESQLAVVRASVASSSFDATVTDRESQRRHDDMLQTLKQLQTSAPAQVRIKTEVSALMGRTMVSPDPAYRNYMDTLSQENCKAFSSLHNSTTSAQRIKLIENLKDYENDARALMASKR
jgi:Family of unknown function (DUF6279)